MQCERDFPNYGELIEQPTGEDMQRRFGRVQHRMFAVRYDLRLRILRQLERVVLFCILIKQKRRVNAVGCRVFQRGVLGSQLNSVERYLIHFLSSSIDFVMRIASQFSCISCTRINDAPFITPTTVVAMVP
jgi:hypothetical protein